MNGIAIASMLSIGGCFVIGMAAAWIDRWDAQRRDVAPVTVAEVDIV